MTLENLINDFIKVKLSKPSNADELLDFLQSRYIGMLICYAEYKKLFSELHERGAQKPEDHVTSLDTAWTASV